MTFSIMATDPETNQIGYAVASKTFSVGIIGFSEPGQAAILCQGHSNLSNGPTALNLIQNGKTLKQALNELKRTDSTIEKQQLGVVDAAGNVLAYTGSECGDWAGHIMKERYTCQGNILTGPEVLASMSSSSGIGAGNNRSSERPYLLESHRDRQHARCAEPHRKPQSPVGGRCCTGERPSLNKLLRRLRD